MSRLTRDGTAEPVSRDQILRHARGQGNVHFPCSADHEQDWQPYPVDPYSAICDDHTYIHTYIHTEVRLTVAIQLTTQKLQLLAPPKKCSLSRGNAGHCCCCYQCTLYFCMEIVLYFTPRTHKIDKKGRGTVFTLSSVHFPISSGLFVGCLNICFCQSPHLMGEIFMFREKSERI